MDSTLLLSSISYTLVEVIIKEKQKQMQELFIKGGPFFMGLVSILFIITTAWFIYHFVNAYTSKNTNPDKAIRKLGYGKTLGLFTLIVGITGQMIGFISMFQAIEDGVAKGLEITPVMIYGAIKVTMIVTVYGLLIYLLSLLMWFVSTTILEKKQII